MSSIFGKLNTSVFKRKLRFSKYQDKGLKCLAVLDVFESRDAPENLQEKTLISMKMNPQW